MREYDFTGLSPRSFEKLVQALAAKVLGPGLVVFGDGADGGREATFEGKVTFPSVAKGWNGYTVVQAKFHQRPDRTKADGDWAIAELKKELNDFADPKKKRRTPHYYIFVTNVVLTPGAKKGSKDRIAKVFADYKARVPIQGFRVWDYDQLRTFLDGQEDVRRSYLPFITAGDVLAEAMRSLMEVQPDFEDVMASYLANELKSTQFANLERAGEQKILLARVFVDLPSSPEPSIEPPAEADKAAPKPGFVRRFVSVASERLDPEFQHDAKVGIVKLARTEAGRYVLVGGPGQGKTTIGQFVCQLFRTAILLGRPEHLVAPEVRDAISKIKQLCDDERIELPSARRFPVQITLSEFAAALSKRARAVAEGEQGAVPMTLLSFITDKIRQRTGRELSVENLRRWLGSYAWLLVLDGLDEVPSSSNRSEVLAAVEQFWIDMSQANSDVLVLATTRPQDYRGDFSSRYYTHEWLTPLSPTRALAYAQRLVDEKYAPNQDRCERVMQRLERAATEENTGRLMRTPLQVTIMTTLLDQIGSPPQDRWRLFGEYYQAIYRREMERDTQTELLSRHRSDINIIHYRVGLELQVLSERAGRTDARLTRQQFEGIVRYRLKNEQEHEGLSLENLQKEIVDLAANRLVFLVGLDADSVGFEIRSLQEFMAAEALMSGVTTAVQERLRVISRVASWRNVFIFAAGRCFAQDEHLIDSIHTICSELNSGLAGERGRAIRAGSLLAIDLLEDGSVNVKPRDRKSLTIRALDIVALPPSEAHGRLANLYHRDFDSIYRDALRKVLTRARFDDQVGGWALSIALIARDRAWAAFLDQYWPADISLQSTITGFGAASSEWLDQKMLALLPRLPIWHASKLGRWTNSPKWVTVERALHVTSGTSVHLAIDGRRSPFSLEITTASGFSSQASSFSQMPTGHASREPYRLTASYGETLNEEAVREILLRVADAFEPREPSIYKLPWQIAAPLACARDAEHLREMANKIGAGLLGKSETWMAAEKRWGTRLVELSELLIPGEPWPESIETQGFPSQVATKWISACEPEAILHMYSLLCDRAYENLRSWLADWIIFASSYATPPVLWPAATLLELVAQDSVYEVLSCLDPDSDDAAMLGLADFVGDHAEGRYSINGGAANRLITLAKDQPERASLIRFLAMEGAFDVDKSALLVEAQSLPALNPSHFAPRYRTAAVAVSLARGVASEQEAIRFAAALEEGEEVLEMVKRCTTFVERRGQFTAVEDRFFLEVENGVGRRQWPTRQAAIEMVSKSARRQKSDLDRRELWEVLALPPLIGQ
jgi:hypothetical protein